jgi:glycosyltransferase 2 family protein
MPVARIGGEIIAVRVMMKHGIRKTSAISSTVVEITLSVIAVFVFDAIGIGMFTYHLGASNIALKLAGGLLLSLPVIAGLVVVQRFGFFGMLSKVFTLMFRDKWKKFAGDTAQLDRAVLNTYRRRKKILYCSFWQFVSWVSGTGEVWLALHFLGNNFSFQKAMMIEALIQATGSISFTIPGALGVQEASIVFFGQMLGLSPEIAAALAVIRRCRDVVLFVPGLLAWQIQEGHWLLKRRKV